MATRAFLDSNVLLYLLTLGDKADQAEALVDAGGVISVQVLNEFASVARRKHALGWDELEATLNGFRRMLQVEPLTVDTHVRAMELARLHRVAIYDANILAAAELAGCDIVYAEDLHDGFRIPDGPIVRNPFANA